MESTELLRKHGLRETLPRRLVITAMQELNRPVSQKDVYEWMQRRDASIHLVTVYRVLESFVEKGIVHRHPSSGAYIICSLPEVSGNHSYLTCRQCQTVIEFVDETLNSQQKDIARQVNFRPDQFIFEVVGICEECQGKIL